MNHPKERSSRMTPEEFHNEAVYQMTLYHLNKMLEQGIITKAEYDLADEKMTEKYKPKFVNYMRILSVDL